MACVFIADDRVDHPKNNSLSPPLYMNNEFGGNPTSQPYPSIHGQSVSVGTDGRPSKRQNVSSAHHLSGLLGDRGRDQAN